MVMVGREMEMVMGKEIEMVMDGREMEMVMDGTEMEMVNGSDRDGDGRLEFHEMAALNSMKWPPRIP